MTKTRISSPLTSILKLKKKKKKAQNLDQIPYFLLQDADYLIILSQLEILKVLQPCGLHACLPRKPLTVKIIKDYKVAHLPRCIMSRQTIICSSDIAA